MADRSRGGAQFLARVTPAHVLRLFLVLWAVIALVASILATSHPQRLPLALSALAVIALALVGFPRAPRVANLVSLVLVAINLYLMGRPINSLLEGNHDAPGLSLFAAVVLAVYLVAQTLTRLPAAQLALFFLTLAPSLFLADVILARRLAAPPASAVANKNGNQARAANDPTQMRWVNTGMIRDETLQFRRAPYAKCVAYYPSNPRGYFHTRNDPDWNGRLDLRTFAAHPNKLRPYPNINFPKDATAPLVISTPAATPDGNFWMTVTRAGVEIIPQAKYTLRCELRATPPAGVNINLADLNTFREGKYAVAAFKQHSIQVTESPRQFSFDFVPEVSIPNASIEIGFGALGTTIEITSVELTIDPQQLPTTKHERHYVEFQMNSRGFRDKEWSTKKPKGTFRVALLGDSMTEAWGVHQGDRVSEKLEQLLNASPEANTKYEVMNFGQSGYSTRLERILHEKVVRAFDPDLVIVMICFNDDMSAYEEMDLIQNLPATKRKGLAAAITRSNDIRPYDYSIIARELSELAKTTTADGDKLALVIFAQSQNPQWGELRQAIEQGVKDPSVAILDTTSVLGQDTDDLVAHPQVDRHPSEIAHRLVADFLHQELGRKGFFNPAHPDKKP